MWFLKSAGERRIETATWGLLLIWAGIVITADLSTGIPATVAGGILLLSAIAQKAAGHSAGLILWAGGLGFLLSGVNDLLGRDRNVPIFAGALVVVGVLLLARALAGGRKNSWQGNSRTPRGPDRF
ncbi:MAG: hypothetical protein WDA27_04555 [Actinomycetota bacterium]